MSVARNIVDARKRAGISQAELADKLAVTQGAVSQWETGQTFPRIESLMKISETLNCSLDELLRSKSEEKEARDDDG